jgi:hypothetical protein
MAEWLILLLLVPAIVVPIVMLVAFAGCDVIWRLDHVDPLPPAPVIWSANATSETQIMLTWIYEDPAATSFRVERKQLSPETTETVERASEVLRVGPSRFEFHDGGRIRATTYEYTVTAVFSDDSESTSSSPVRGTTLLANLSFDELNWEGWCLVQRIEAARLSGLSDGTNITLTLRGPLMGDAWIDRIYISNEADTGDLYDSAHKVAVYDPSAPTPFPVPMNAPVAFTVNYTSFDKGKALLIAVDFSSTSPSTIKSANVSEPGEAVAYFFLGAHAAETDRTLVSRDPGPDDGQSGDRISLIEQIEVE